MQDHLFEWFIMAVRWFHIITGITWIGESFFFMWLDRSFKKRVGETHPGHVGEVWMVHGGGFYNVEKFLLGPTEVPRDLHWFKWEAAWTWISGITLLCAVFYSGQGTFLLDSAISDLTYPEGVALSLVTIFGSWFFYDLLWESSLPKRKPVLAHAITIGFVIFAAYWLCNLMAGRAAYIHLGAMIGTWMVGNVWVRILPRQAKMIEQSKKGEPVNQQWGLNAKNRSTHNTYFTLPIIFIMLSNHFPNTYGHEYNWIVLLLISISGAAVRHFFVIREKAPVKASIFLLPALIFFLSALTLTLESSDNYSEDNPSTTQAHSHSHKTTQVKENSEASTQKIKQEQVSEKLSLYGSGEVSGVISFTGEIKRGPELRLPGACARQYKSAVYKDDLIVSESGLLKNAFIRITKGLGSRVYNDIPSEEVVLDQRGCVYRPRIIAPRVGQKVRFLNSDPLFHNVKSFAKQNRKFNINMPKKNDEKTIRFKNQEIFVQTKCSIHPWMGAYIAVMDHPFYALTDEQGQFSISNIPDGEYTIKIWHEKLGEIEKSITIDSSSKISLNHVFK